LSSFFLIEGSNCKLLATFPTFPLVILGNLNFMLPALSDLPTSALG
jgi:hypothetical protein